MAHAIAVALFLHLFAMAVWLGGMVFAHFCLAPSLADLTPQARLPVVAAALGRFFNWIGVAVIVLLLTGVFLMGEFGGIHAPWPLHAMAGLGVLMMLVFGHVRFAEYPRIQRAVQAERWPDGARVVAKVRALVLLNLVLGTAVVALAAMGRGF
jgi:uncharacterized membrane protein